MLSDIIAQLAPTGVLYAGINLSNPLLVTGLSETGTPVGVSPDMVAALAARLDLPFEYRCYERAGDTADAAGECGVVLVAAEPQRAQTIVFSPAYAEIEATYLVPEGSPLQTIAHVDQNGVRIVVANRTAYDLWLSRNIQHATLVRVDGLNAAFEHFVAAKLDALAGLRPVLQSQIGALSGARVLEGRFATVQQAIGTAKGNLTAAAFIRQFVEEAKATGLVKGLIARHNIEGLIAAPTVE